MADKSDSAFRTISEAAEEIGVPAHVLRFWETRFAQLQPLKRAGGRRYYRPADMALLRQIRGLLHDQGMTIRGAQLALQSKAAGAAPRTTADAAARPAEKSPEGRSPSRSESRPDNGAGSRLLPANIDRQWLLQVRDRLAAALAA